MRFFSLCGWDDCPHPLLAIRRKNSHILKLKCHEIFLLCVDGMTILTLLLAIRLQNDNILKFKCHEIFVLCVDGMTTPTPCSPYAGKMDNF
jgi:hypothetical protein